MANYDANKIRNIVFLGHQSSGKTSLVESLYFLTGGTNQKGEVEKKNTVSDYTPEEQKRGASIQTAVVPVFKGDVKVNLIDVPGNDDFIGEYLGVLTAVDGAVIVIDASTGVQVGTVKHYNALRRKGIPTLLFVNKMDKEGVDTEAVVAAIKAQLNKDAVCFAYPDGQSASFKGFVDLVKNNYVGLDGKAGEIPGGLADKVTELHAALNEEIAKTPENPKVETANEPESTFTVEAPFGLRWNAGKEEIEAFKKLLNDDLERYSKEFCSQKNFNSLFSYLDP